MKIYRYENNPLVVPEDVKPHKEGYEVIGAFNAGITSYGDEIIMLLRVAERPISYEPDVVRAPVYRTDTHQLEILEFHTSDERYDFSDPRFICRRGESKWEFLTSLSYLRIARSKDGRHFTVDDEPAIYPFSELEVYGIEDPRITAMDDGYYIYYSAASSYGVGEVLAYTADFVTFERRGMIFAPENKDVLIFPEKINGKYYALHRPVPKSNADPEIWIAESDNLLYWGNHQHLIGLREGMWDDGRIGGGAVPIKTERGWLELYHGASKDNRYCMGAILLDLNDPSKVIARSTEPFLVPEAEYEMKGFFGGVVFSCGAIVVGDTVKMYYGAADTCMAGCEFSITELLDSLGYV
ncbi:glycoside hydrolase family 130 protein [Paenibacillus lautus]|uniref:BtaManbiosPhlase n=1 Tax=Paenibacillus lautus TaxID=1401 RepID=UPI003D2DC5F5